MNERGPLQTADIVVVGGASAAFEAAIAARQAGAEKIVMLEKAAEHELGGNARFSHTGFRFVHAGKDEIRQFLPDVTDAEFARMHIDPYSEDDFQRDLVRVTRGRVDRGLAQLLVEESNEAVHWTRRTGLKWEASHFVALDGDRYYKPGHVLNPVGGGLGQVKQWRAIAEKLGGIELRWESPVAALRGTERLVEGVDVSGPDGRYSIEAPAVILCAGGFQASTEMRARYLPPNADVLKVRGSYHNTGEVLQMAIGLGALASGQWGGAHATAIGADAPEFGCSNDYIRYSYKYGVLVNNLGLRFFDEGEADISMTYAKTGWAVQRQPDGIAYQLYDAKTIPLLDPQYRFQEPVEAQSIPELARKLGIPPVVLERTVTDFNKSIVEFPEFDPTRLDGRGTEGLQTPKSNWAIALDEPPFRAYAVTGGITFTFGGIAVDTHARVLNTRRVPIQGLYASGDIIGLFYHNYPGCTGQTRNVVFSRRAAAHATG